MFRYLYVGRDAHFCTHTVHARGISSPTSKTLPFEHRFNFASLDEDSKGSRVDQDDVSYTPRETLDGNCSVAPACPLQEVEASRRYLILIGGRSRGTGRDCTYTRHH